MPEAVRPLSDDDTIEGFDCGAEELDDWFRRRARKAVAQGDASVFVYSHEGTVHGFSALAASGVSHRNAPGFLRRNAPDPVPVLLLARLGVDRRAQHRGVGQALLFDAVWRAARVSAEIGFRALIIHARDDNAAAFYRKLLPELRSTTDDPLMLALPTSVIRSIAGR